MPAHLFAGRPVTQITLSAHEADVNLFTKFGSLTDARDFVVIIASGIQIYRSNPLVLGYALDTGTGYHASSTIRIVNHGYILGAGGKGGNGGSTAGNGSAGGNGTAAIRLQKNVVIDNTDGFIGGGGGGGGGGAGVWDGGSGGGGGQKSDYQLDNYGAAGSGGGGNPGTSGSLSGPGTGGAATGSPPSGAGGNGGAWGDYGSWGADAGGYLGGAPGSGGNAIALNGYAVTWEGGYNSTQVKGYVS